MIRPDDIAANLPPPRDDEPASLRRDIVDELADHLSCALDREVQRQTAMPSEPAANEKSVPEDRVLERFGSPSQIAMRLWWDAMWGKVMTQRVLIAFTGVLTLACCVAVVVTVQMTAMLERANAEHRVALQEQQRALAVIAERLEERDAAEVRRQEEFAAVLKETRQASAAQIERSQTEAEAAREGMNGRLAGLQAKVDRSAVWNPAEIRLVREMPGGVPVRDFRVRMDVMEDPPGQPPLEETSDEEGKVRFERVRAGVYLLRVYAPWKEAAARIVRILPGDSFIADVICPKAAPEPIRGRLKLALPDDLRSRPIWFRFPNDKKVRRVIGGEIWSNRVDQVALDEQRESPDGEGRPRRLREDHPDPIVVFSSDGALHSPGTPNAASSWGLDIAPDGEIRGIAYPGADYQLGDDVTFFTTTSLDRKPMPQQSGGPGRPRRGAWSESIFEIPDCTLKREEVRLSSNGTGEIVLSVPDRIVKEMRALFEKVDAARAAGDKVLNLPESRRSFSLRPQVDRANLSGVAPP